MILRKRYTPVLKKQISLLKYQKKRFHKIFHILESFIVNYRKVTSRVRQHRENLRQLLGNQFNYWQSQLTDRERELSQAVCITPRTMTLTTWQSSGRRLIVQRARQEHLLLPCREFCPIHCLRLVARVQPWRRKDSLSVTSPLVTLTRLGSVVPVKTVLLSPALTASARLEWWWRLAARRTGGECWPVSVL